MRNGRAAKERKRSLERNSTLLVSFSRAPVVTLNHLGAEQPAVFIYFTRRSLSGLLVVNAVCVTHPKYTRKEKIKQNKEAVALFLTDRVVPSQLEDTPDICRLCAVTFVVVF